MFCEVCKKKTATIHYKQIIDGKDSELHLCETCAQEKGISALSFGVPFSLADLMAGFLDSGENIPQVQEVIPKIKCSRCGLTAAGFKNKGKMGCSHCYYIFRQALQPLLRRIHGSTHHLGKVPSKVPTTKGKIVKESQQLRKLREELHRAVKDERFEEAAVLRDRIRKVTGKGLKSS